MKFNLKHIPIRRIPSDGRWGAIARLRDQMRRSFSASISCIYLDNKLSGGIGFWQSIITLGKDFFEEIIEKPVPIDMRALKALKTSLMVLDLYCWLTYRFRYSKR